jgi:integrase
MKKITGTGSVFYNSNKKKWVAQYVETENGISTKKCIYGKTKEIVSNRLTTIMYNYHNNNYIKENGMPLIQLLKQNREDKFSANLISESHYSRLEFVIKEIEKSDIGNMDITKITTRDLQNYFNSLIDRYTNSTIKKIWECVKQGFELAIDEKYIIENPFKKVLKPKSKKDTKVLEALTVAEHTKLSQYLLGSNLNQEKYKNVILVQLYSGLRVGEVLALSAEDIDFDNQIIYVRKTVTVDKNGDLVIKKGAKTYAGKREVPLDSILINSLKEQCNYYIPNKDNLLFTFDGRIIKASTINTVLKRICKQLNLSSKISNHTLRHTFGTRCIEAGMNPVVVQRIMGHKDIKVTLNTYTSVLNKYKTEEFNKVALYYLEQNIRELPETTQDTNEVTLVSSDYTVNEKEQNNISIEEIMNCYKYTEEQILALFDSKEEMEQEEEKADIIWKQILEKQKRICD